MLRLVYSSLLHRIFVLELRVAAVNLPVVTHLRLAPKSVRWCHLFLSD